MIVLVPGVDADIQPQSGKPYRVEFFKYGMRRWQRLAHYPGGIPDVIRRCDPAILLVPFFIAAMFLSCVRLAGKVDIMHGNWSVPGLVAALAARIQRRASITTLRGEDVNRAERSRVFGWLLKSTLRLNDHVVVVSESMKDRLELRFPHLADHVVFIPNGVSIKGLKNRPFFRSPLRLLTVGSLIHRKRIETLLHALYYMQKFVDVKLRIVGEGPERAILEEKTYRLSIQNKVEFVGSTAPEEVEQHLRWADIFVFASESEGRPNVVLEAMAAGLPVVATDISGVRELLCKNAGLLFPVGDALALVKCVQKLIENPERARNMGYKARHQIEKAGLTWDSAAIQYIDLYKDAISRSGGRKDADGLISSILA